MKIRICSENRDRIETELKKANGKATVHCFTQLEQLIRKCNFAELKLEEILPRKADHQGATYTVCSAGKICNAYKYRRSATTVTLYRGSAGWFLTRAVGMYVWVEGGGKPRLTLTEKQDAAAIDKLRTGYWVDRVPKPSTDVCNQCSKEGPCGWIRNSCRSQCPEYQMLSFRQSQDAYIDELEESVHSRFQ